MNKKKKVIILGTEMAQAYNAEQERISDGNYNASPMPNETYDKWPNERPLLNPEIHQLDSSIMNLTKAYFQTDSKRKDSIRKSISMDEIYTLLLYSKRASIFSIRNNNFDFLQSAINSIAMIEAERCDFRDILVSLSLIYYSAINLGINADELFRKTAKISDGKTGDLINGFAKRSMSDKDILKSWGFFPIETKNGIGFLQTYFKKYTPKFPIHEALLEISTIFHSDEYGIGDITVGSEIASFWLSSKNDKEFSKEFRLLNGCAQLSTHPKNDKDENNMLLIYLAEFKKSEPVENIYSKIVDRKKNDFSRLLLKQNNLLCLVIGRSIMVGVKAIESDESLKRFEEPIRAILRKIEEPGT